MKRVSLPFQSLVSSKLTDEMSTIQQEERATCAGLEHALYFLRGEAQRVFSIGTLMKNSRECQVLQGQIYKSLDYGHGIVYGYLSFPARAHFQPILGWVGLTRLIDWGADYPIRCAAFLNTTGATPFLLSWSEVAFRLSNFFVTKLSSRYVREARGGTPFGPIEAFIIIDHYL